MDEIVEEIGICDAGRHLLRDGSSCPPGDTAEAQGEAAEKPSVEERVLQNGDEAQQEEDEAPEVRQIMTFFSPGF